MRKVRRRQLRKTAERKQRGLKRTTKLPRKSRAQAQKQRPARRGRMRKGKSRR